MAFFEFPHTRTYDSDLGWLIRQCKTNADAIKVLQDWTATAEDVIGDLQKLLEDVAEGIFPPEISNAIRNFIITNFYDIVGDMAKMVFFGLTDSGYFVAYIPDGWDDITFNTTGWDIILALMPEYGHLVLSY